MGNRGSWGSPATLLRWLQPPTWQLFLNSCLNPPFCWAFIPLFSHCHRPRKSMHRSALPHSLPSFTLWSPQPGIVNHWHPHQAGHQDLGLAPASELQGSETNLALVSKEINPPSSGPWVVSAQALDSGHFFWPPADALLWKLAHLGVSHPGTGKVKNCGKKARNEESSLLLETMPRKDSPYMWLVFAALLWCWQWQLKLSVTSYIPFYLC